ncbi:MAG: hypothetical protein WDN09_01310 [bacterium]
MKRNKKECRSYGGYVNAVSLTRAVRQFLPDMPTLADILPAHIISEIPNHLPDVRLPKYNGKYNFKQHNRLVNLIADLIEKVRAHGGKHVLDPFDPRAYPVLHKDATHIYETAYYEIDRLLGFSGFSKDVFVTVIKRMVNRVILEGKFRPHTVVLLLPI